jgi:integrase/recombinase XerD
MTDTHDLPVLLERFFTQRLMAQRRVSAHTIGSYRDTFRLLLLFAQRQLRKPPSALSLTDLHAPLIGLFLDDLESHRGNTARSRNLRLSAIRSFFRFAAFEEPAHAALIQRVLAIPNKRYEKKLVGFSLAPRSQRYWKSPI